MSIQDITSGSCQASPDGSGSPQSAAAPGPAGSAESFAIWFDRERRDRVAAMGYYGALSWRFTPGGDYVRSTLAATEGITESGRGVQDNSAVHSFELFARLHPHKPHYLPSPLFGHFLAPLDVSETQQWYGVYRTIRARSREARLMYLENALGCWMRANHEAPSIELRAGLAMALIAEEGLWSEFRTPSGHARFRSANQFLKAFFRQWGWGCSPTKCSRLCSSADLWLRLEARDLPLPAALSHLNPFGQRADAVRIYEKLSHEAGGRVPTVMAIAEKLAEIDGRSPPRLRVRPAPGEKQLKERLTQELLELVEANSSQDLIRAKAAELRRVAPPPVAVPAPPLSRRKPEVAPYDVARGSPITLSEDGMGFHVEFLSLEESQEKIVRTMFHRARWGQLADTGGPAGSLRSGPMGIVLMVARPDGLAHAHHRRNHLNSWANRVCDRLQAPRPVPLPGVSGDARAERPMSAVPFAL